MAGRARGRHAGSEAPQSDSGSEVPGPVKSRWTAALALCVPSSLQPRLLSIRARSQPCAGEPAAFVLLVPSS